MMETRYEVEKKDVFGFWEHQNSYSTEEQARKALPAWRIGTKRDLRIVKVIREEVAINTLADVSTAISASQDQEGANG